MPDRDRTSSRREFLRGTSAARAIGDALAPPPRPLPPPQSVGVAAGTHLLSVSREAMACLFEVVFDAATYRDGTDAAVEALELVAALEAQLTVYRETSEIQHVNRRAAHEPVAIEAELFGLLERAVGLFEATGGAFDATAGALARLWSDYRRRGQMPPQAEVAAAMDRAGSQHLLLDRATHSVRFAIDGLALNLGAIGKGHALDRAAKALAAAGVRDFLMHGGNSSVLARGNRQRSEGTPPGWTVALRHPLRPDVRLAEFDLVDQALGTSGSGTQFFHHGGKRYGHIIDPRSGWPAEQVLSATVIAPTAEHSDALSTALYVMGLEAARDFCRAHADIGALLVTQGRAAGSIELHPLNLADDRWRRLGSD